jgi:hypothetical protein
MLAESTEESEVRDPSRFSRICAIPKKLSKKCDGDRGWLLLPSERGPSGVATTCKEHIMNTTHPRQAVKVAVVAGATAFLLALSASAAHAGPGAGPEDTNINPPSSASESTAQVPLQVHASENPVVFNPLETTKTITLTWNPPPTVAAVTVEEDGYPLPGKQVQAGEQGPLDLTVKAGKTYTIQLKTVAYQLGPVLTITTKKQLLDINPR